MKIEIKDLRKTEKLYTVICYNGKIRINKIVSTKKTIDLFQKQIINSLDISFKHPTLCLVDKQVEPDFKFIIPLKDISNLVELFYSHEEFKISFLEIAKFIKNNSKLLKNLYKELNKIIEILPDDVKLLLEAYQ